MAERLPKPHKGTFLDVDLKPTGATFARAHVWLLEPDHSAHLTGPDSPIHHNKHVNGNKNKPKPWTVYVNTLPGGRVVATLHTTLSAPYEGSIRWYDGAGKEYLGDLAKAVVEKKIWIRDLAPGGSGDVDISTPTEVPEDPWSYVWQVKKDGAGVAGPAASGASVSVGAHGTDEYWQVTVDDPDTPTSAYVHRPSPDAGVVTGEVVTWWDADNIKFTGIVDGSGALGKHSKKSGRHGVLHRHRHRRTTKH